MTTRHDRALHLLEELREGLEATVISDEQLDQQATQVVEVARRLAGSPGRSQILRDPVGTGKTAVALTAARLLLDENRVDYLLVIAPNDTVAAQWEKRAAPLFAGRLANNGKAAWSKGRLLVRTHKTHPARKSPSAKRTLVIVDEAHRGLQDQDNVAHLRAADAANGAMTLLVTATPYQLTTAGFTTMLSVAGQSAPGEAETLKNYGSAVARVLKHWDPAEGERAVADLIEQAEERRDKASRFLDRHLLPKTTIRVPPTPPLKPDYIPLGGWATPYAVARILPELTDTGKNDAYQRGLASSSETVWSTNWAVGRRLADLRDQGSPEITTFLDQLQDGLGTGTNHPKVKATVRWVKDQVRQDRHVVIFTSWLPTQQALGTALQGAFGDDVGAPRSGQVIPKGLRERFEKPAAGRPVVLVLSDRFSESIDLDGGHPSIVHHDLSWNPVRITQRWGRVVRIRTGFRAIPPDRIYVPVLDVEVDRRVAAVVAGRRDLAGLMVPNPPDTDDEVWTLPNTVLQRIAANFDA